MKRFREFLFFLIIALPINSAYYPFLDFLTNRYGVSFLDVLFVFLLILEIIYLRPKLSIRKSQLIPGIILIASFVSFAYVFINSYSLNGMRALRDAFNYIMCWLFLFSAMLVKKESWENIIRIAGNGFIGYTVITVLSFVLYFGLGQRVSGNAFSLAILVVPYEVYCLVKSHNSNRRSIIILLCFLANVIISQDRAVTLLTISATAIEMFIVLRKKITKKVLVRSAVIIVLALLAISALFVAKAGVIIRILTGGEINTMGARINTFSYYWELFLDNLNGYGFGYIMHFFTSGNYMLPGETYQIDSALIVYAIKGGIVYLVTHTMMIILPLKVLFENKGVENKIFIVTYIHLFVSAYLMTSQVIQGRATALIVWSLIALSVQNYKLKIGSSCITMGKF